MLAETPAGRAPIDVPALALSLAPAIGGFLLAAVLTFGLSLVVLRLCRHWGLFERPEPGRKQQRRTVPRLGGLAIFAAVLICAVLLVRPANVYEAHIYGGLLAAALLIVGTMAVDDLRPLSPRLRLGVQTVAALIAIFPLGRGTLIEVLHNPLIMANGGQTFLPLWLAIPFTWFWIVGMMNTVNWVDGVDGLASGVVTITALVMGAISWLLGQQSAAVLCFIVAGASLGFLPLNWHPARLFMGDSGAMFLGLALAVLANVGGAKLAMMLLLLGLPILDTARVIVRRLRAGRSPLRPDRSHLHYRLLAGGLTHRRTALLFYAITAAFGLVTLLGAYLQTQPNERRLEIAGLPWLSFAFSELPTLLGLVAVAAVSVAIWRIAAARRRRVGLPPGASYPSYPSLPGRPSRPF